MTDDAYPDALPAQHRLHWYLLERVLGQGGFGITYLARDTNLDQSVAIKEYLPVDVATRRADTTVRARSDEQGERYRWGLERFIREARTLARFDHPNIVRVLSVFEQNGTAYMVMRFEEGENFAALLDRKRTIQEAELMRVLLPVLEGLELVHNAGFIHRDIKPDNIHIRADGTPVLLDFGSARNALGHARTVTILVAPGYAPFEQYYSSGEDQGPWTDIYSLGATCYRAIAGVPPMDAIARSKGVLGSARDILVPASAVGSGRYSERLLKAIDHALEFAEKDRPQTIAEWRNELPGLEGAATTTAPPRRTPAAAANVPRTPKISQTEPSAVPNSPHRSPSNPHPEPTAAPSPAAAQPAPLGGPSRPAGPTAWLVASALVGALLGGVAGAYAVKRWADTPTPAPNEELQKIKLQLENALAKAETERVAREKAEADKARAESALARSKAETERLASEKTATEKALSEATARARAETDRAKTESERAEREKAVAERAKADSQKLRKELDVAKAEIERLRNLIPGRPPTDTTPKPAPPPPDAREAFRHYLDLARRGDGSAALKVGELYEAGRGVAASNNWAYAWYSVAERCGVTAAKSKKDAVANRLQPVEIRQADKLAESQADCKK